MGIFFFKRATLGAKYIHYLTPCFQAGKNHVSVDNDSEESTVGWNPTPLYAGQIKPLHRHTSPSSTESSVKTGKELVNVDPSNEKMKKIFTMRELAMRRLAKRHKTVLPQTAKRTRLNVDVSLNLLFKETSTFERVRPICYRQSNW